MPDRLRTLRPGQSFVGLLMVLLILTLLTALAAPRVDLTRFRSDAMARQVGGVFSAAAREARRSRYDVVVRVDPGGRRISTLQDRNANGVLDPGEREVWMALDPGTDLLAPVVPLPLTRVRVQSREDEEFLSRPAVVFRRGGGTDGDYVLYLTSDTGLPNAWRAVHVTRRTGIVQLWRFDGRHWTRARS